MKILVGIFLYITILLCFSCEEQGWFVNCSECQSTEPENSYLSIKLKETGYPVILRVYEGVVDDSILYFSSETTLSEYSVQVKLNKRYTSTATYNENGNTYIAVDSAFPRVKYTKDECDEACYFVYDKVLDLRLKYTAPGK